VIEFLVQAGFVALLVAGTAILGLASVVLVVGLHYCVDMFYRWVVSGKDP
jgi:hypothetical protein